MQAVCRAVVWVWTINKVGTRSGLTERDDYPENAFCNLLEAFFFCDTMTRVLPHENKLLFFYLRLILFILFITFIPFI